MKFTRRSFVGAALAAPFLAKPGFGQARGSVLRVIPHADLKNIDPIWTTAYISRNHGYMVYDTLFAMDKDLKAQPQMVDKWEASSDGKTYTFVLRDGLSWHDGKPVTAADCAASLVALGQARPDGATHVHGGRELHGPRRQDARDQANAPLRPADRLDREDLLERAVHDAEGDRRDRSVQADRKCDRLRAVHLPQGAMGAGLQGRLRQEPELRSAQGARPRARLAARSPRSIASSGFTFPTRPPA